MQNSVLKTWICIQELESSWKNDILYTEALIAITTISGLWIQFSNIYGLDFYEWNVNLFVLCTFVSCQQLLFTIGQIEWPEMRISLIVIFLVNLLWLLSELIATQPWRDSLLLLCPLLTYGAVMEGRLGPETGRINDRLVPR